MVLVLFEDRDPIDHYELVLAIGSIFAYHYRLDRWLAWSLPYQESILQKLLIQLNYVCRKCSFFMSNYMMSRRPVSRSFVECIEYAGYTW